MLTLLLGPDPKVYRSEVMRLVLDHVSTREGKAYMIVPEQFSFDTERALCRLGGDTVCRYAEVLSLSRLASRVESIYGGGESLWLDQGGRLLVAAQAAEQVHSRLKLYAGTCKRTDFLEMFLSIVDEFGSYGITSQMLADLSVQHEGQFAQKLSELALLYESYLAVSAQAMDPVMRLQHLRQVLAQEEFACEKSFYICGFVDFTTLEREILQELILSAEHVVLALPDEQDKGMSCFPSAESTVKQFTDFCHRNNVPVERRILSFDDTVPAELLHMQLHVSRSDETPCPTRDGSVRLWKLHDREEECRLAAQEVVRFIQQGSQYHHVGIACADMEGYAPILQNIFTKCGIPHFVSGKQPLAENSAARMLLTAIRAAADRLELESVLEYLKSGAASLTDDSCDRLENYAKLWKISGRQWKEDWTSHPRGIQQEWKEFDREYISKLNTWRRQLAPLFSLTERLHAAGTVGEMTQAVHDFAQDIHLHCRLQELSDHFFSKQDLAKAQTYVQIYDTLMDSLEQLHLVLHDAVRTPDEFCDLYEKLISRYGVAAVPASLDQVLVGDIGTFRGRSVRHLIILGANEGSFPAYSQGSGVFTEDERRTLMGQGLPMAPLRADVMDRDLGNIYLALRSAQKSISITCSGEEPAFLMTRFCNLFGAIAADTVPVALNEGELAAELLHKGVMSADTESLDAHMRELHARSSYSFGTIQKENVRKLYGEELELSASKVDKFASCRFAYFMRYGLRANVLEEARFDASQFGTFVHDVLENTAREVKARGGFHVLTEEQVLQIAEQCSNAYKDSVLKDLSSEDKRFDYLFSRNAEEAMGVVSDLWRELQCSEFTPEAFELGFGADKDMEAVTVQGKSGAGRISGFVDRVDLYQQDETTYVRVVDYKTGRKAFDYADLTVGEGLQMLIYLFALQDKGEAYFGTKLEPAGVLYHLARKDIQSVSEKPDPEKISTLLQGADGRKGLLIDDEAVLTAMEKCEKDPRFLPFKRNKDGERKGNLASEEEMKALKKFVFRKLGEITDGMLSGVVTPDPVLRGAGNSACTYCDFADVCKKDLLQHNPRKLRSITNRQFFNEIMEGEGEDHGAE